MTLDDLESYAWLLTDYSHTVSHKAEHVDYGSLVRRFTGPKHVSCRLASIPVTLDDLEGIRLLHASSNGFFRTILQ